MRCGSTATSRSQAVEKDTECRFFCGIVCSSTYILHAGHRNVLYQFFVLQYVIQMVTLVNMLVHYSVQGSVLCYSVRIMVRYGSPCIHMSA